MISIPGEIAGLMQGPLLEHAGWPMVLTAEMCDLRPRFIPKKWAGRGHRAIARNGRVLLAGTGPLEEWAGTLTRVRLQAWHKTLLPNEPPVRWGVLVCLRQSEQRPDEAIYVARLVHAAQEPHELALAVGGEMILEFRAKVGTVYGT